MSLAKTPNGYPLPWSELVHKFNKYFKGFQDVADQVAFQTQVEKAASGYGVLKQLESRHSYSLALALAYYSYAMGRAVTPTSSIQYEKPPQWLSIAQSIINEHRTMSRDRRSSFGDRETTVKDGPLPISDGVTARDFEAKKTRANGSVSNGNGHSERDVDPSDDPIFCHPFSAPH
ncbi:hypothetical protein PAXINDRAFT_8148 [Paxillus involutus ATCC 200175]|nr:hypothetical protein PAXINDRAFT_8148 [Paxillus involutus ATCC 200175]